MRNIVFIIFISDARTSLHRIPCDFFNQSSRHPYQSFLFFFLIFRFSINFLLLKINNRKS